MGILDIFRGNNNRVPAKTQDAAIEQFKIREKTFELVMREKQLPVTTARVALIMDDSGSMEDSYNNGLVQTVVDRILPIASKFDDNQSLEMYKFSHRYSELTPATPKNFFGYVKNNIKRHEYSTTKYAPVMRAIIEKYGKNEPSNDPTFVIFITDGRNDSDDIRPAEEALRLASGYNIFWKFVGIGDSEFPFLEKLDDLKGRKVDNANFIHLDDIGDIDDKELYERLLEEYSDWQKAAKQTGILA